jgi:multidrug efflux pump subunit AcrA (membrane-fusion protein)
VCPHGCPSFFTHSMEKVSKYAIFLLMKKILSLGKRALRRALHALAVVWARFRALPRWAQALTIAILLGVLFLIHSLLGGAPSEVASAGRSVTLRSVAELSGTASGESVVGSVRARSEALMRAEAAGTVRRVTTSVGASVPAGYILAELENDSQAAAVLQAEGAYDAAVASRASVSPTDVQTSARNAYRSAFETLDAALENQVDTVFGEITPYGPKLLINPIGSDATVLSRERDRIDALMDAERIVLASAAGNDSEALLAGIERIARQVATFVDTLVENANAAGSNASPAQVTALTTARAGVNGALTSITGARATLRSGASASTASVDAGVKSALGTLRLAQASLEKTRVRAPIAGTVNFLPIRVGDYVGNLDHVATVAQNGALEIVSFVSEESRIGLEVGAKVVVEDTYPGTITSIAPALDPVNKQIEVHVSVDGSTGLVNGQTVRLTLPGGTVVADTKGPILLPLSAVKLSAGNRVVFTIGEDGRLKAIPITIGEVLGERIQVLTELSPEVRIVEDARGLADGQQVKVAP